MKRCQWPENGVESLLHVPKNAENNAEFQDLDVNSLVIIHIT